METLVMLMLVSMAAAMMFQMLDSYRLAQQRVSAQAGEQDRASLVQAWFADTIAGLFPDPDQAFIGSEAGVEGKTLNPLFGAAGAPAAFAWRIRAGDGEASIEYVEDGKSRWTLPLRSSASVRFLFFSADGKEHSTWPPAQGLQGGLPAAVALVSGDGADQALRYVSVRGPLAPRFDPFELEQE
ncbi:hypothetical protein [Cognatilysobacter xinjiangensis]|nr:hypothetical protein [Lysobacter xinjiangensis]